MTTNNDAMRYLATVKRQSAPPRCNPCTIVLQVLAIGMVFIGLTMTIIAHWPGSTSIGENPLKIAGPILLAVGSVLFVIGIVLICCLNRRERRRWERMIDNFAASRPPLDQSSFGPPGLKTGNDEEFGSKLPPPVQQPDSGPGTRLEIGASDPRPGQAYHPGDSYNKGGYPYPGGESSFTVDEDEAVPSPVRSTKKRRPRNPGTGSNDDLSGESLLGATTVTTTTTTTRIVKRPGGDDQSIEESSTTTHTKTSKNAGDDGGGAGAGTRPGTRGAATVQPGSSSPGGNRLLVHVKAQPGATVHIHPSGGPAVKPKPAFSTYSHSTGSGETDI